MAAKERPKLSGRMRIVPLAEIEEARSLLKQVDPHPEGLEIMLPKALFRAVYIREVRTPAALILKQEMLAKGGEAALHQKVLVSRCTHSDVVLMGTLHQYQQAIYRLMQQPFGLKALAAELAGLLDLAIVQNPVHDTNTNTDEPDLQATHELHNRYSDQPGLKLREHTLSLGERTLILGILNLTPDSFSDGGKYLDSAAALAGAQQLVAAGADILDVGAESTRPGYQSISAEEEWDRLKEVLPQLIQELSVPISLDTCKAEVARRGLEAGVHLINDIWGLRRDPEMASVVAHYQAGLVIMHNREEPNYANLLGEVVQDLGQSLELAAQAGIDPQGIILDPGIGFGKNLDHNLALIKRLPELRSLGYPLLLGTSRKSLIGQVLDAPVDQRTMGTAATVALGIAGGADLVRIHQVAELMPLIRMSDAIQRFDRK